MLDLQQIRMVMRFQGRISSLFADAEARENGVEHFLRHIVAAHFTQRQDRRPQVDCPKVQRQLVCRES